MQARSLREQDQALSLGAHMEQDLSPSFGSLHVGIKLNAVTYARLQGPSTVQKQQGDNPSRRGCQHSPPCVPRCKVKSHFRVPVHPVALAWRSWALAGTGRMTAVLGDPASGTGLEGSRSYATAAEPPLHGSSPSPGRSRARNVTLVPQGLISDASRNASLPCN